MNIDQIKKNIRKETRSQGKTIQDLCKMLGYGRNHVNRLTGESAVNKVLAIAAALNIPPHTLFR